MSEEKVIAVVGATGRQGGGLVEAILAERTGGFAVRALTRDPHSAAARALAARGAEVVRAELDDEASLRAAFKGAHGAYVMTNFWEPRAPEQEQQRSAAAMELDHARNAARAAKEANVSHVIWSTLADTRAYFGADGGRTPTFEGTYKVPHADAKADADRFFTDLGIPVTFLQANMYYEAFLDRFAPRRDEAGTLTLALAVGDARVPAQSGPDVGRTALGVFRAGQSLIGRRVSVAGDILTGEQYAATMSRVLGEPVAYRPLDRDVIRGSGLPGADEVGNMLEYFEVAEADIVALIDRRLLLDLNPGIQDFESWLRVRKDAFPRG